MFLISSTYYSKDLEAIYAELETNPDSGLEKEVISARLARFGFNELPKVKTPIWKIYLAPIFNYLILMLIIMAIPIAIFGNFGDTILTFGVIIVNGVAAVIQQMRAQKTLKSLMKLTAPKATIIRNGAPSLIDAKELVPGDIIEIKQGDRIPADCRIISHSNLEVNEAALTGESEAVLKSSEILSETNLPLQKQFNMVFQGTFITQGKARAVVTYTGGATEIGKISTEINQGGMGDIPLTRKMNNFAKILAIGVVIMVVISLIYQSVIAVKPIDQIIVYSIAVGKNLVPINLPLLSTLVLITGVYNLAKQGVIIRNLAAIEALGRVSVICSDKTGTITKNEMTVEFIGYSNKIFNVPNIEYPNTTPIYLNNEKYDFSQDPYFELFIQSLVLNNNAKLTIETPKITLKGQKEKRIRRIMGAPTEGALLILAENIGYTLEELRQKFEILKEFSFDSSLKRMSTLVREKESLKQYAFVKGASELIIERSSNLVLDGKIQKFTPDLREKILEDIEAAAKAGFRTLSIASKTLESRKQGLEYTRDDAEQNLTFLGFVSILDPPREGVKESVLSCQKAGVAVVMITGDHPITAEAIALQTNIFEPGNKIVEGKDIDNLGDKDFRKTTVFARVSPQDKVKIVKRYQDKEKRLVAMTGDGVNDAIALKQAHTGIAMGITGSDVAKETADMIITDDNFNSIERGLRIGRGIFHRIRVIIFFYISINLMEAVIFFGFLLSAFSPMYTVLQHTYIFAIAHTFPPLALIADKTPSNIMDEPPRNSQEILTIPLIKLMVIQCIFMGLGIAIAYLLPVWGLAPLEASVNLNPSISFIDPLVNPIILKGRTMSMTVIFLAETMIIWSMRRPNASFKHSFFKEFNKLLMFLICFIWFLHIGAMYFGLKVNPVVENLLGSNIGWIALNWLDWLWIIGLASMGIVAVELYKWYARRKHRYF